jgi:uncharacterized protein YbgA (DUF1722 family)
MHSIFDPMRLISIIRKNLINIPGWRTYRKIVVIESDDWGSIRTSSHEAFENLLKKGYPVNENEFNRMDALESNKDIELLMDVLSSVKDKNGHPAILTLNNVVANPDFEKIKESDFKQYYFEPFTETLKRYPAHDQVYNLLKIGVNQGLFRPQYHGREHLNVGRWMRDLRLGKKPLLDAFEHKMYSLHFEEKPEYINEYMDSLDFDNLQQLKEQEGILREGFELFSSIWGFQSKSFIANCYTWHPEHERYLNKLDVKYIQGIANQFVPLAEPGFKYKRVFHYLGQKNKFGQRYLVRNAFFEPYQQTNHNSVSECLARINLAFQWKKPAIISTHRINFIGSMNVENRDKNLKLFTELLTSIAKEWPDVEFLSSDELGDLISSK